MVYRGGLPEQHRLRVLAPLRNDLCPPSAHEGPSFIWAFLSIVRRIRETRPDAYNELVEAIEHAGEQFERQHRNALRNHRRIVEAREDQRLEIALQWYASFFETNLYLWFLCVLARFMRTGRVKPEAFGGPLSQVVQGALVNQALENLANTPLHAAVAEVYDTQVRNAVGHNDYEVTPDRTKALIRHPEGRTFTWEEAWAFFSLAQDFHQALLGVISTVRTTPRPEDWQILREYGVTSFDWLVPEDGPIEMMLHQLWCFAELDPDGCWLDSAEMTICELADSAFPGDAAIRFGTAGFIHVPKDERLEIIQATLERQPWILVIRYPIAPYLGLGYPRYRDEFEVVGMPDEHIVRGPFSPLPCL